MSRAMGLLLRQWREERKWSREQLVDAISTSYPNHIAQEGGGLQLPSEKTIQRGESGQTSPTVRTLTVWIGALQGVPEERLNTFFSELLGAVFTQGSPRLAESPGFALRPEAPDVEGEQDTSQWRHTWWRNLLSFVSQYHEVPEELHDYFVKEHPRRTSGFFNALAMKKVINRQKLAKKETLLLVDDEINILTTYSEALCEQYEVLVASDGREALNMIEDDPTLERIGVIISDQRMPEMCGLDFLRAARVHLPHAQRIILTAYSDIDVLIESINQVEIYRYFVKPFNRSELLLAVEAAFQRFELEKANQELEQKLATMRERFDEELDTRAEAVEAGCLEQLQQLEAGGHFVHSVLGELQSPLGALVRDTNGEGLLGGDASLGQLRSGLEGLRHCLECFHRWTAQSPFSSEQTDLSLLIYELFQELAEVAKQEQHQVVLELGMGLCSFFAKEALSVVIGTFLERAIRWSLPQSKLRVSLIEQEDVLLLSFDDQIPESLRGELRPSNGFSLGSFDDMAKTKVQMFLCRQFLCSCGGDIREEYALGSSTITLALPKYLASHEKGMQ